MNAPRPVSARAIPRLLACMWRQRSNLVQYSESRIDGQRALITGGNGGIGYTTTRALIQRGAEVTIACRNPVRAKDAADRLAAETGRSVDVLLCDLSDLRSVASAADTIEQTGERFDVVICNAGIWAKSYAQTAQGHEISFGVNVLGHMLLIQRLLDRGGLTEGDVGARVVLVSGDIYILESDCTPDYRYRGAIGGQWAYCRSKLGDLWLRHAFADAYPRHRWYAVHPGVIVTNLAGAASGPDWLMNTMMISAEEGAMTSIACATSPNLEPGYYHNTLGHVSFSPNDPGVNEDGWRRLYAQCLQLTQDFR